MDKKQSKLANIWLIIVAVIIIILLVFCTAYYLWINQSNQIITTPDNTNIEPVVVERVEEEVVLEEFLAYFKVRNDHDVEIYRVDKDGQTSLIEFYNEDLGNRIALDNLLSDANIYISDKGDQGYTVLDYTGQDVSADYPYLKKKNFDISHYVEVPGYKRLVYSLGPGQEQLEGKPLIVAAYDHSTIDYIESDLLPNNIITSRPFGWSANEQDLYVTKIGWEGFDHADLWKVNFESKEVTHIENADKLVLGGLDVNPGLDIAVGVEVREVPCTDCMGDTKSGAPASLYLFDLKNNTSQKLITDNPILLHSPALSPDGQKIFYTEGLIGEGSMTYMMDLDGSDKQKLGDDIVLESISQDGQIIITRSGEFPNYTYTLVNLEDNTEFNITVDSITEDSITNFIQCNYPLGFSCLY